MTVYLRVFSCGPLWIHRKLLATVKRQKLAWCGHVTCHDNLSKTILQGTIHTLTVYA